MTRSLQITPRNVRLVAAVLQGDVKLAGDISDIPFSLFNLSVACLSDKIFSKCSSNGRHFSLCY